MSNFAAAGIGSRSFHADNGVSRGGEEMFVFLKCCEMCENQSFHLLNSVLKEYGVKIFHLNLIFKESGDGDKGGIGRGGGGGEVLGGSNG